MKQIIYECIKRENQLLEKYFGNLVNEAAHIQPATIEGYDKELPLRIEAEYKEFLRELWREIAPDDACSIEDVLDMQELRQMMTDDEREIVENAYNDASRETLWEKITNTNHKDVTFYKGVLKEYTKELLLCMRCDFLEEVTGGYIEDKVFE